MSTTLTALAVFAAWALLLVCGVAGWRTILVLSGRKQAHDFKSGQEHGAPVYWRIHRAHMNTVENLVVFAVIILIAEIHGVPPHFGSLAVAVVGCRMAQSIVHIAANTHFSVIIRATFFFTQILLMGVMLGLLFV